MHDLYEQTAEASETIIPELIKRGYQLVTVSELAQARGVSMENGKVYYSFYKMKFSEIICALAENLPYGGLSASCVL